MKIATPWVSIGAVAAVLAVVGSVAAAVDGVAAAVEAAEPVAT